LLQSIERCGYDAAPFLEGLSVEARELVAPSARVPWDDLVKTVEGFGHAHGQAELNRVARDAATALPRMRQLGALLLPPRAFYWVLLEVATRTLVWNLRWDDGAAALNISLEVRKGLRCGPALLEALAEFLAATPRLLNLEDTRRGALGHPTRRGTCSLTGKTLPFG
jgi:hypothetical protein